MGSFHEEYVLERMGLSCLSWVIVEALKPGLVPGIVGDVDILAGPMDFQDWNDFHEAMVEQEPLHLQYPNNLRERLAGKKVSEAGGIKWPPEPPYVVGIEVKCAYFTDKAHSTKSSAERVARIRNQIDWLQKMGLDRFALLDVIGNIPSGGWIRGHGLVR